MTQSQEKIRNTARRLYQNIYPETFRKQIIDAYIAGALSVLPKEPTEPTIYTDEFFSQVAIGLRNMWPVGEKDGKYPWKDSIPNLIKRLRFLWKDRDIKVLYTVDDCLRAGRRYLSQFEDNTKYMQTLKYFIFKQTSIVGKNGKITYIYKSTFGDLLEGQTLTSNWDDVDFEELCVENNVLI